MAWKTVLCIEAVLSLFVFYPLDASSTPLTKTDTVAESLEQTHLSPRLTVKDAVLHGHVLGENK